jgi:hypothetical protein
MFLRNFCFENAHWSNIFKFNIFCSSLFPHQLSIKMQSPEKKIVLLLFVALEFLVGGRGPASCLEKLEGC